MTEADNSSGPQAPTQEQAEQFRQALIAQIANDAKQLLGLVGFVADDANLFRAAALQFDAQTQVLQQTIPLFSGMPRAQFPVVFVQFTRPGTSLITLPGQPAAAPFVVGGPKQLNQDSDIASVASTVAALGYLSNPALRVVCTILGVQLAFGQAPAPRPPRGRIVV